MGESRFDVGTNVGVDTRRLVLGDWNPWIRDGIDLLRMTLVVGAVGYLLAGDTGRALVLAVIAAAALLARAVNLPRPFDLAFVVACNLQGWGEVLNAFDEIAWFDRVVHLSLPALAAPVIYIGLARLEVLLDPRDETHLRHYLGVFVVTFALGLAVGAVWEIVEWASDGTLGSSLQEGNTDTVGDLLADTVGSLIGAALLVLWTRNGWGSVRRIPGENRYEDVSA